MTIVIITTINNDFGLPSVAIVGKKKSLGFTDGTQILVLAKFIHGNFLMLSHFLFLSTRFPYLLLLPLCPI